MNVKRFRTDTETITAVLSEEDALRILTCAVAKEAGQSLDADYVRTRAHFSTRDTSIGVKTDCKVEIVIDYSGAPVSGGP